MANNVYDVGDLVKVIGSFKNSSGVLADPEHVFFSVIDPSDTKTDYTFGVDSVVTHIGTGTYQMQFSATKSGDWYIRGFSTGTGQAAQEIKVSVRGSRFVP